MNYKLHTSAIDGVCLGSVILIETNTVIPFDPDNTDYVAYLAWCAEGNEPLPAEAQAAEAPAAEAPAAEAPAAEAPAADGAQ